jgi:hypothetical protein
MFVLQMIFAYPDTLANMTVEAMGVYVSDFMERLVTDPCHQKGHGGNHHLYQDPCRRLAVYINRYVPFSLANVVTIRIMRHVDVTYTKLMKNETFKRACAEIAPIVLKSVIPKSVKKIDCIHDTWHPTLLDYYKIPDCDLIYRSLPILEGLKELKLGRMDRFENISLVAGNFTNTLEKFSCRNIRMHDLDNLSKNCKNIRSLDIGGTAFYSAKIFNSIFQFKRLEKLNLSLLAALSKNELHRTVNWMAGKLRFRSESPEERSATLSRREGYSEERRRLHLPRPEQLKFFGCVNPEKQLIPILTSFSNLNSLVLSYLQMGSLTPLTILKQLQNLTLIESRFSLAEEFLIISGHQMKCLNLINCSGTDFKFISHNCRSLECLHLQFKVKEYLHFPVQYRFHETNKNTYPDFPKVTRLQLRIPDPEAVTYITNSLQNVKKLSLLPAFNDDYIFEEIFERRLWRGLEEFYWGNKIVLKFNGNVITVNEFHADGTTSVHHVTYQ